MAFDRPTDGIATATAPAALAAAATTALEAAFRCGIEQTFTPPPPPDFPSALAPSPPPAHTGRPGRDPSPVLSEYAPEAFSVLEGRLAAGFARPALTRNSLQPCNATRPSAPQASADSGADGLRPIPPHKHKEEP